MGTSVSDPFVVQVVRAPALPQWLRANGRPLPLYQWIDIPNSVLADRRNLPDTYFLTNGSGLVPPSRRPAPHTGTLQWDGVEGKNKYGIPAVHWNGQSWWSTHYSYSGMGFDRRGSRILLGGGDAHWAENSYHRFAFGVDTPYWEPAIVRSTHYLDFKTNDQRPPTAPLPRTIAPDDDRQDRHYDGRHRGGHTYWSQWFIEARNWMCHFESHQYWPIDHGHALNVHVADLATGDWRLDEPIAPVPEGTVDNNQWKWKHPLTEDVYQLIGGYCYRWRQATNKWERVFAFDMAPYLNWGTGYITGGLNWQDNYILCEGRTGSASRERVFFLLDMTRGEQDNLAVKVDVTFTGPAAAKIDGARYHAQYPLVWNPDLQLFLAYYDSGVVYGLRRSGPAEFHCEVLPMQGAAPNAEAIFRNKGGGVLSCFQYVPELKGMVLRLSDQLPMKFFRTG